MSDPADAADPLIGRVVGGGRYEILAVLGRGGMGTVYRARQRALDRVVVLKLIHRELASDPGVVGRFQREMRVTAAIEHPNTVRVYDFGDIDGQPFLAMEFLAGRTVRDVLAAEGAFPPLRLASVGIGVANALGAAHMAGIVHRDLKPDNVMLLDAFGEPDFVKVLDFGIARPLEREMGYQTATGVLLGTPIYMSPEQCSGAPVDARSDLYALGVMLYEMAAGEPPFGGGSFTAVLVAHATTPPPPLAGRAPGLPVEIEALIMHLLAKAPADRPATAEEVVQALAPFGRGTAGRAAVAGRATGGAGAVGARAPTAVGARAPTAVAPRAPTAVAPAPAGGTLQQQQPGGRPPSTTGTRALSAGGEEIVVELPADTDTDPPSDRRRSRPAPAAPLPAAAAPKGSRLWLVVVVIVLVLGGAGAGVAVLLPRIRAGGGIGGLLPGGGAGGASTGPSRTLDAGGATTQPPRQPEQPKQPKQPEQPEQQQKANRPTAAEIASATGLLAGDGEPAWPDGCRPDDAATKRLAAAARALGPEAGGDDRKAALASLRGLPDTGAARWLAEARATLATDPEVAAHAAERAVAFCPASAVAAHLRGNALQKLQQLEPAETSYREAIRLAPAYAAPRFNLGLVQLRRGAAADALATLEPLVQDHPDLPNLFLVRAEAHRRAGDTAAALGDLEQQTRRHPDSADGWYQLGRARAARKLKGADDAFCKAKALGHAEAAALCRR